ncbi:uncharacterized protein SAPINGB_P004525 [Magnusiomyces paraingens]|uniref:Bacterial surface antigen (D15) domain-containing protein n=1 Tax=Magnusiomyces paraingens TaxID=2606893 RepID=A0A5E8C2E4_9ASCO|nr:uncharacterized protein SAPINGB_P004525 [Saprochaete ingens]VVT55295.1 unnamed protein product [Saprochaete ingens]
MASPIFGDKLADFHDIAYSSYSPDDVAKLLAANQTLPVSIASFKVQGAGSKTRSSFLRAQIDPLVNAPATRTLPELLKQLDATARRFKRFGTYSAAEFKLDLATVTPYKALLAAENESSSSPDFASDDNPLHEPYRGIKPLDLKATLILTQANPHPIHLKSVVRDNGPAAFSATAALKNLLGGAETLSIVASRETSPTASASYAAEFSAPLCIKSPDNRVHLSAFSTDNTAAYPSLAFATGARGASLKLVANSPCHPASFAEFGVATVQRTLSDLGSASETVKNTPAQSTKTSVYSRFAIDLRTSKPDSPLFVDGGYLLDWQTEAAGLGDASKISGDVAFLKTQAVAQASKSLDPENDHIVFSAAAGTGLLWSYARPGYAQSSTFYDRFFLGGPNGGISASSSSPPGVFLHAYTPSGLGPRDGADAIGGDAYAAGSVSVLLKLPRLTRGFAAEYLAPLRVLAYFTQASLIEGSTAPDRSVRSLYKSIFDSPTTSGGLGLIYRTSAAQLELIYSAPFVVPSSAEAAVRKGWQLGVGFDVDL